MMLKEAINDLLSIIQQEFKIYSEMFYLLDEEYNYLVAGDSLNIQKVVLAKENFLQEISVLEQKREGLCKYLAEELKLTSEIATLKEIASKLDEASSKTLLTWKSTFDDLIKSLKEKNDINSIMARAALDTVESTIDVVKDSLQTKHTYQKKGGVKGGEQVDYLFSKKA